MKILYVTTVSNTVNAFLIPHIKMLVNSGYQVDVAFAIDQEVDSEIYEMGCKIFEIPFQRSPFKANNFLAYKMIRKIIIKEDYKIVHTHTPVASTIVRLASRKIRNVKVMYTAHGFHFYKGAPIINWLVYYPIEKILSKYTDVLITINKEDYQRAKNSFKTGRIEYLPGVGIDLKKINNAIVDKKVKRDELNIPTDAFIILSVGELNQNKNHEAIISALASINNPSIYYLVCGQGNLQEYLSKKCIELGISQKVKLLGFQQNILEFYKVSDLFAFPSFREGLPVSLIEAMASGLPVIASNIRGNRELVVDGLGGYLFDPKNILEIEQSIHNILKNNDLKELAKFNQKNINKYEIGFVLMRLSQIYERLIYF